MTLWSSVQADTEGFQHGLSIEGDTEAQEAKLSGKGRGKAGLGPGPSATGLRLRPGSGSQLSCPGLWRPNEEVQERT
jgi:hypothetical protein